MKLVEIGYDNLYFKSEKDKYASLYGAHTDISKIGFQTNAMSRGKILTKLEQVVRNKTVNFYSSRLHDEFKTFVWKGTKAQAQKGKNDDLVIATAIGTWLFDSDPKVNKQTYDLNKAMLAGFAVNSRKSSEMLTKGNPWDQSSLARNPFGIYKAGNTPVSGSKNDMDFGWLV